MVSDPTEPDAAHSAACSGRGLRWVVAACVATLLLLALALDLVFFTGLYAGDDRIYLDSAWTIANGDRISFQTFGASRFAIVLPLAIVFSVFGYELFWAGLLFVLYHLALVGLTFNLGRVLHGALCGLVAAALIAIWPTLVNESSMILPDILMACCVIGSITLLVSASKAYGRSRRRAMILVGLSSAVLMVGYMAKIAVVIYLPAMGIFVLLIAPRLISRDTVLLGACFAGGVAAVYALDWLLIAIFCEHVEGGRVGMVSGFADDYVRIARTRDASKPLDRVAHVVYMLRTHWTDRFMRVVVASLVAYPFLRRRSWFLLGLLAWVFLYRTVGTVSLTTYAPPTLQARYYTVHLVLVMVMGGHGLSLLAGVLGRLERHRLPALAALGVAVAICYGLLLSKTVRTVDRTSTEFGHFEAVQGTRDAIAFAAASEPGLSIVLSMAVRYRTFPLFAGGLNERSVFDSGAAAIDWRNARPREFFYLHARGIGGAEERQGNELDRLLQQDPDASVLVHEVDGLRVTQRQLGFFSPMQSRLASLRASLFGGSVTDETPRWAHEGIHLWRVTLDPTRGRGPAITGGDFEHWEADAPAGWTIEGDGSRSAGPANRGIGALALAGTAWQQVGGIAATPGAAGLRLATQVRVPDGATGAIALERGLDDGTWETVVETAIASGRDGGWRRVELPLGEVGGGEPLRIVLRCETPAGDACVFDEVAIEPVEPGTPQPVNGGFERRNPDGTPVGWTALHPGSTAVREKGANAGAACIELAGGTNADNYVYQSLSLDASHAGARVTVRAQALSHEPEGTVLIVHLVRGGDVRTQEVSHPGDGHWHALEIARQLPLGFDAGELRIVLKKRPRPDDRPSAFDTVTVEYR